ncbi:MAG: TetR/AcrR family transcriptional regulator [Coriobacteriia bacterium]|nr:TetR/AcrR family transcriptional regulator [Coriobacteriia bacterium]
MKKQPQITEQTRANLREAFWALYAERPIERIPVREICERAGYNRATFYLYYHDVYEVLAEVEDTVLQGIQTLVEGLLARGEKLDFSRHMGLIFQMAADWRRYTEVLLGQNGDPAFVERLKETLRPLVERFVLPAKGLDGQAGRVVSEFYLSGILAAVRAWLAEEDPMPIDALIRIVVGTVFPA